MCTNKVSVGLHSLDTSESNRNCLPQPTDDFSFSLSAQSMVVIIVVSAVALLEMMTMLGACYLRRRELADIDYTIENPPYSMWRSRDRHTRLRDNMTSRRVSMTTRHVQRAANNTWRHVTLRKSRDSVVSADSWQYEDLNDTGLIQIGVWKCDFIHPHSDDEIAQNLDGSTERSRIKWWFDWCILTVYYVWSIILLFPFKRDCYWSWKLYIIIDNQCQQFNV